VTTILPERAVLRNAGISTTSDPSVAVPSDGNAFTVTGLQVRVLDENSVNYGSLLVGHRGSSSFTIESKSTVNGNSSVDDIGANAAPNARADLLMVGNADRSVTLYWQLPNNDYPNTPDNWQAYNGTGQFASALPAFGADVYVGVVTYAYGSSGVPFVGSADAFTVTPE